jgi:hypothetical protein
MKGYRDGRAPVAFETDVASLLADGTVADLGQCGDAGDAGDDGEGRHVSGGDVDVHDLVLGRQGPTFALAVLEAELDRLTNVREGILLRLALADAAVNQWALDDDPAVLTWMHEHWKLHESMLLGRWIVDQSPHLQGSSSGPGGAQYLQKRPGRDHFDRAEAGELDSLDVQDGEIVGDHVSDVGFQRRFK